MRRIEDTSFAVLILAVSMAFAWIVQPLFGAILWGVIASILFAPLNDRLLRAMPTRNNLAALLTLLVIMAMVILPAILLSAFLLQEVAGVYARMQSGEADPGTYFLRFQAHLPQWLKSLLTGLGLSDFDSVRTKLTAGIAASFQTLTARAFSIGQSAFGFVVALGVMLYLTFFLLRDGKQVAARVETAIPLDPDQRAALLVKFAAVIRATIKGSLVVAVIQGAIGGIVFWALGIHSALLWGVLMAFLSLLPAIGTGIVWAPVAVYLLVTGAVWEGVILILCGLFVIGLVDNLLRPILVGRDARMPDYVVLISTLGGLQVLGFNGLVIGPVAAALFIAAWDIFARSRFQPQSDAS
ncbi:MULTISPECIES: AI-2E family transporter [Sphingobium]|uniref:AI-2E family transporter n=1 Tax=Sphingobium psychrophilum TaxID=2728834 RepID=A0A7X9WUN9_9SPHN|nr:MULTISPECIES: AI-2E family transporter [Sphingobium]EXS68746.1 membrane protein [Sphingobium sp. Ant17]NML10247.1 AI-2E family transporter [Sphingobium psychrophilum]WCP12216.1 Putative transport protein [Sphingobium sp. AntQ-1]